MKHWHCDTHGNFDATVAVGCPECVRMMREQLKKLRVAFAFVLPMVHVDIRDRALQIAGGADQP